MAVRRLAARTDSLRASGEVFSTTARAGRIGSCSDTARRFRTNTISATGRSVSSTDPLAWVVADIGSAYDGADRRIARTDRTTGTPLVSWHFEDGRIAAIETGNGLRRAFSTTSAPPDRAGDGRAGRVGRDVACRARAGLESAAPRAARPRARRWRRWRSATGCLRAGRLRLDQRVGRRVFGWSAGPGSALRRYAWDELGNRTGSSEDDFVYDASARACSSPPSTISASRWSTSTTRRASSRRATAFRSRGLRRGRLASHGTDAIAWDMAGRPIAVTESGVTRGFRFFGGRIEGTAAGLGVLDLGDVVLSPSAAAARAAGVTSTSAARSRS